MRPEFQQCIDDCLACFRSCTEDSAQHCLEAGGRHVEPAHFRLMLECAAICRTAAEFMMLGSERHAAICAQCADICEACARSCDALGDMQSCADQCRRCAESCRLMAGGGGTAKTIKGQVQPGQRAPESRSTRPH